MPDVFDNDLFLKDVHKSNLYLAKKKAKVAMQNMLTVFTAL